MNKMSSKINNNKKETKVRRKFEMTEKILNLIEAYKGTQECLEEGLKELPDNYGAKAKIELLDMVISDLEESIK